jgi:DNA-binding SARP family transcriptional activator
MGKDMQRLPVDATPVNFISTESSQSIGEHRLSLSVFGNMSVAFRARELKIKNRKSRALLAFLALSESVWETRERLIGVFWSESEERKALASLRQSLREIRQAFLDSGFDGLQTEKLTVHLDRRRIQIDLWDVIHDAEVGFHAAPFLLNTQRVTDIFLAGFDDLDPVFRIWLLSKRQTIHDRLLRALESGLRSDRVVDREKMKLAEAILNLDPTHEETCRYLMRTRASSGDVAGALRVYKKLWDELGDEYDMEPSPTTLKLVAEIKSGRVEPATIEVAKAPRFSRSNSEDPAPDALGRSSSPLSETLQHTPLLERITEHPSRHDAGGQKSSSTDQGDVTLQIALDYVQLAVGFVGRQPVSGTYIWPQISLSHLSIQHAPAVIDARGYLSRVLIEKENCSILLLGDYGSGKTSFCYMLGREFGLVALQTKGRSLVPLYLNLKKLRPGESIFDAIARSLSDYGLPVAAYNLRSLCAQGTRLLLLLDGLDEAGDRSAIPDIGPILSSLGELREVASLSWILTSRGTFFTSDAEVHQLGTDIVAELQPFTEADVRKYFTDANLISSTTPKCTFEDSPELLEICKTPVHLYLLVNLLQNTANIHQLVPDQQKWSINLLYDEFIRYSIKTNFTARLARWRVDLRLRLLRCLAFHWFKHRVYEWPIGEFERFVYTIGGEHLDPGEITDRAAYIANCGFFTRAHDKCRFIHLSILEYLAAWHLAEGFFSGDFVSWEEPLYTEVYEFIALIVRARSNDISTPTRQLMTVGGMRTQANFAAMAFRHRFEEILPYLRKMMFSPVGLHRALSMQGIGLYPPSLENVDALLECAHHETNGVITLMTALIANHWLRNYDAVPHAELLVSLSTRNKAITSADAHEILGDDDDHRIRRAFRKSLVQPNPYWTAPAIDLLVLAAIGDQESFSAICHIGTTSEVVEVRRAFLAVKSIIDGR